LLIEFIGARGDSIGRHERGTVRADAAVMQSETEALRARTKRFTLDVLGFLRTLPGTDECRDIAGQLRRSAGGVGANYRATCRARSRPEFIARINVALEEAELLDESNQLCAIFTASSITATEAERRGDPDPHRRGSRRR
jgi:four helix bundle protein